MKKTVLALSLSLVMGQAFAQAPAEVLEVDKAVVAQELEKEAETGNHDKKTKTMLKKVALEFKKLDDCSDCKQKSKSKIIIRNVARKLGRGSAWLSTATSKPFLNASGFVTGVFEKKEKNQDVIGLYKFFLNHSKEFDKLYLEASTPIELGELMLVKIEEIVGAKKNIIMTDFLKHVGVKEIPEDFSEFELSDEEIEKIDKKKISASFVNNHPEYEELKPIIGEVTDEDLQDIITSGVLDKSVTFENYKESIPKIHEGALTMVGQLFAPKIVLGVVSSTLATLYATPVALADIGTAISGAVCVKDQFFTQTPKYETDQDLAEFCSYVVNRSAYELMKSRARGYVAGKKTRVKLENKFSK